MFNNFLKFSQTKIRCKNTCHFIEIIKYWKNNRCYSLICTYRII